MAEKLKAGYYQGQNLAFPWGWAGHRMPFPKPAGVEDPDSRAQFSSKGWPSMLYATVSAAPAS